ncbi:hypothetical protein Catovirus_1_228 [Catovirus CTV1]|uniref:Uncharacterized protein n=1 Tax=Catovirus CTV1 TaxID=1977631 RepID=A0A1V0S958_9VIRU|nr:hypothetical protein Catovirus_1_228 [Catovirus CTV1]
MILIIMCERVYDIMCLFFDDEQMLNRLFNHIIKQRKYLCGKVLFEELVECDNIGFEEILEGHKRGKRIQLAINKTNYYVNILYMILEREEPSFLFQNKKKNIFLYRCCHCLLVYKKILVSIISQNIIS